MQDANRGTGRTTLMLFDAYMAARGGNTVYVLFTTRQLAREGQRTFRNLFKRDQQGSLRENYCWVAYSGGKSVKVYFLSVQDCPRQGTAGFVLADHTVIEQCLAGEDEVSDNFRAWQRVPEGRKRT